jgi:Bacteriophage HK97-gp10, putative tail-component
MADGFEGLAELIADLQRLPESLKKEAERTIEAAANGMAAQVRQRYPRGKTSNLIKGVGVQKRGPLNYRVVSRAQHAHLYEFGSVRRWRESGATTGTMPEASSPVFVPEAVRARRRQIAEHLETLRRMRVRGMENR